MLEHGLSTRIKLSQLENRRLKRRARLDALYFLLYGITDRDDVRYIYFTFPIVEAGDPDADIKI